MTLQRIHNPRRRIWRHAVAVLLGVILACIFIASQSGMRRAGWIQSGLLPREKRIVVLPFSSVDPAHQLAAGGFNDIISHKIAQLEQFHGALLVVAASEVNSRGVTTPSAARELLGADLAVMGIVMCGGDDKCQIVVSLVETRRLVHLCSAQIDVRSSDITTLSNLVISRVAQMLDLEGPRANAFEKGRPSQSLVGS